MSVEIVYVGIANILREVGVSGAEYEFHRGIPQAVSDEDAAHFLAVSHFEEPVEEAPPAPSELDAFVLAEPEPVPEPEFPEEPEDAEEAPPAPVRGAFDRRDADADDAN